MNYYNQISDGYEELHKEEQLKKIKIIKQHINIKPNSKILDLGCGPYYGNWDKDLKGNPITNLDIYGVDPSSELLKLATKKGIKTYCEKAEELSFPTNTFDYIISITAIQNFDDIEKGVKEIKRVLNKENKNSIVVVTYLKRSKKKDLILKQLSKHFNIEETIEGDKDIIIICKK